MGKKRGKPKEPNKAERMQERSEKLLIQALARIEELKAENAALKRRVVEWARELGKFEIAETQPTGGDDGRVSKVGPGDCPA